MFGKLFTVFFFITSLEGVVGQGKCSDVPGGPAVRECDLVPGCDSITEAGRVLPIAKRCSNKLPDADCEQLFPCDPTAALPCDDILDLTPGPAYIRAPACTSPALQSIALQCAKQCSMCCLVPEYNCGDDDKAPINCTLNSNKCNDPQWTEIMAQYCPNTCGLCTNGTCRDINSGCNTMTALCKNVDWMDYMTTNCARKCDSCNSTSSNSSSSSTCVDIVTNCVPNANLCTNSTYRSLMLKQCCATCNGTSMSASSSCSDVISNCAQYAYLCTNTKYRSLMMQQCCATCSGSSSISSYSISSSCSDSSASCSNWKRNGFCNNSFYTTSQKRQYCGRTCNLC